MFVKTLRLVRISIDSIIELEKQLSAINNLRQITLILKKKYNELMSDENCNIPKIYLEKPETIKKLVNIFEKYQSKTNNLKELADNFRAVLNDDYYFLIQNSLKVFNRLREGYFEKKPMSLEEEYYLDFGEENGLGYSK